MKSQTEILLEARRLEQLGGQWVDERRRALAVRGSVPGPRILMAFPESVASSHGGAVSQENELKTTITRRRWIEAGWAEDALEYRLIEAETETAPWGEVVRESGPGCVLGSEEPFDALVEGYELGEQDRLGPLLAPYAERAETGELLESVDPALVHEVERIIGAEEFPAGSRIGAKRDILAFLEGRIDASEFIGAAISRGRYRAIEAEGVEQRVGEQITIDGP